MWARCLCAHLIPCVHTHASFQEWNNALCASTIRRKVQRSVFFLNNAAVTQLYIHHNARTPSIPRALCGKCRSTPRVLAASFSFTADASSYCTHNTHASKRNAQLHLEISRHSEFHRYVRGAYAARFFFSGNEMSDGGGELQECFDRR